MQVCELMTRELITVAPQTRLADAADAMLRHHITGLPVLNDHGHLVGMITEGDLLRRPELGTGGWQPGWLQGFLKTASLAAEYVQTHSRRVGDVMNREPVFVRPETPLARAAELMQHRRIKRLVVLRGETPVGILSRADLLRALVPRLVSPVAEVADAELQAAIEQALARELWVPNPPPLVAVENGVVVLTGQVFSDEERRAACVLAENTAGVREVIDQLALADVKYRAAN